MKKQHKGIIEYVGIAGSVSLLGLLTGWIAILFLLQGMPYIAIIFAVMAFYLDTLDGFVARKTHTESEFGRQLDGSIDLLNYLVFSALFFWKYLEPNLLGAAVCFIILASGIIRLIRFNIEGFVKINDRLYYEGIVVCHVSLTVIILFYLKQFFPLLTSFFAVPVIVVISLLQISRILIKKTNTYGFWLTLAFILILIAFYFQIWHK